MKKLLRGIVDFRKNVRPSYKDTFAQLALGQKPDALFIACSDSRVVPNVFASSDAGDLFVIRNVGNLIPTCDEGGHSHSDESEAAAIEYSLLHLPVTEIIVCGHSECGAMSALAGTATHPEAINLKNWLRHGRNSAKRLQEGDPVGSHLAPHNQLSQLNVLEQLENLKTYPTVAKRFKEGSLSLHGWWFDIKEADVYEYSLEANQFRLIDESYAPVLLQKAEARKPEK